MVPIYPEAQLTELIRQHQVDLVAFSWSDVTQVEVMHKASRTMAEGEMPWLSPHAKVPDPEDPVFQV